MVISCSSALLYTLQLPSIPYRICFFLILHNQLYIRLSECSFTWYPSDYSLNYSCYRRIFYEVFYPFLSSLSDYCLHRPPLFYFILHIFVWYTFCSGYFSHPSPIPSDERFYYFSISFWNSPRICSVQFYTQYHCFYKYFFSDKNTTRINGKISDFRIRNIYFRILKF